MYAEAVGLMFFLRAFGASVWAVDACSTFQTALSRLMAKENSVATIDDQLNALPMEHANEIVMLPATVRGALLESVFLRDTCSAALELVCAQSPGAVDNAERSLWKVCRDTLAPTSYS